jgi:hypothetical protein
MFLADDRRLLAALAKLKTNHQDTKARRKHQEIAGEEAMIDCFEVYAIASS